MAPVEQVSSEKNLRCHVHPRYKAIRAPRPGCILCRAMWQAKLAENERQKTISEEEWMRRLRARFVKIAGEGADDVADAVAYEEWRDGWEDDPEGAADEEMSYWDVP